ncbi:MAG: metal-dependent hydrolase [Gemmatimonadota bacterium]|nr:metal-dependent hydrolase [Gemmatimonadota bacterium]MDH3479864.1 metal-dependent hydrolase [Gemmatimonadota bacterium]MDH3571140.1 metal-dependent hydrolase [Gemmatimonadota bacterium]MDH5550217.1 metal-dependent hydrolase [Gemmatimonadota bacterium]
MPNTLAHIGAQVLITRGVIRRADLRWALLGAIVPDVPWILGRATQTLTPALHDHQLWAYLIAQSSLLVSLILCAALASVAAHPGKVFGILSLNALLHLVLDALQAKWGNGVHLFAPISWQDWNAGWFDLESWPTFALTALGLAVGLWVIVRCAHSHLDLVLTRRRMLIMALLLGLYLAVPIPLRHGPLVSDTNSVGTLSDRQNRPGRDVQFDRVRYLAEDGVHYLRTYVGEKLRIEGHMLDQSSTVSARATFVTDSTLVVHDLRRHTGRLRELLSYLGLSLVAAAWVTPAVSGWTTLVGARSERLTADGKLTGG